MKYQIVIWWSDAPGDQVYIAQVPELPRCMAHGDTYQEALANILEAMEFHLEVLAENGFSAPAPRGEFVPMANEFDWKDAPPANPKPTNTYQSPISRRSRPKTPCKRKTLSHV